MFLMHHGILGQKWGVRRYQNPDGTRTSEGKRRRMYADRVRKASKTNDAVNSIVETMSLREKQLLMGGYTTKDQKYINSVEEGSSLAKRVLIKDKDTPVSFFDIWDDGDYLNVALGTRNEESYRHKGYAKKAASRGMKWYESNKDKYGSVPIIWGVHETNKGSIAIAKKMGFKYEKGSKNKDGWLNYVKT